MAIPTDRGFVVIRPDGPGTNTVLVCAGVSNGRPAAVFAAYGGVSVNVASDVQLLGGAGQQYTSALVEVFVAPGGSVAVRMPGTVEGMPS
jgi:hypothetical protein